MKPFIHSLVVIIATIMLLFVVTLLLDISFIQAQVVRQIIVYIIMLILVFIAVQLIVQINKNTNPTKLDT